MAHKLAHDLVVYQVNDKLKPVHCSGRAPDMYGIAQYE